MTDKTLKEKAISFKGKAYVLVADRVLYFNENYPKGSIITELLSAPDADRVIVKAVVRPNAVDDILYQSFTGHSQAKWSDTSSYINKSSALENAETSAVGRALALMGIGVIDSIASIDEINKANQTVNKIQNGENFTADEYEDAVDVLPDEAFGAINTAKQLLKKPVQYKPRNSDAVRQGIRDRGEADL